MLKARQKGIYLVKVTCLDQSLKMVQINTGGKMLGIIMNNNAAPMIAGGCLNNLHGVVVQRICLGMKFNQTQIPLQPIQAGRIITGYHLCAAPHHRKPHRPIWQANWLITPISCFYFKLRACYTVIGGSARCQLGWQGQVYLCGQGFYPVQANRIDHLKRAALPVKAQLHRIINILRRGGNLWHQTGSIG